MTGQHGGAAWARHVRGLLTTTTAPDQAPHTAHDHRTGAANCPTCQARRRTCGQPDCPICGTLA